MYSPAFKNITEKEWKGWKLNKYRQDTYSWGVHVKGIVNVTNNRPEHPSCDRRRSGLIKTGTINCWPRREGKVVWLSFSQKGLLQSQLLDSFQKKIHFGVKELFVNVMKHTQHYIIFLAGSPYSGLDNFTNSKWSRYHSSSYLSSSQSRCIR